MKKRQHHLFAAALGACALGSWATSARADGAIAEVHETRANRAMIGSGIVTLGISYGASAIVAAQSDHPGDHNLFVPVAGPWMDLVARGGCDVEPCAHETGNKVLLVADGIFQALGAFDIVAGLLMQETVVTTAKAPVRTEAPQVSLRVSPTVTTSSYGLAAVGTF